MSYGVRRTEFDSYLLRQFRSPRRRRRARANRSSVAAARGSSTGHSPPRCSSARAGTSARSPVTSVMRPKRLRSSSRARSSSDCPRKTRRVCGVAQERPELYFCADLRGYGWCFRKENYLNVGSRPPRQLAACRRTFTRFSIFCGVRSDSAACPKAAGGVTRTRCGRVPRVAWLATASCSWAMPQGWRQRRAARASFQR